MTDTRQPSRWAEICTTEIQTLFDDAESGVDPFVEYELAPLSKNLLRAVNLRTLLLDLGSLTEGATASTKREDGATFLLESEFQISKAFARWCIGPVALDLFINQTFGLLQDALGRRHGVDRARELIAEATERLAPTRTMAMHELAKGPVLIRVLSGPGSYLVAPALWLGASLVVGAGRRERERTESMLSKLIGTAISNHDEQAWMRAAAGGLMSVATAAVIASVGYRVARTGDMYRRFLVDIETLICTGARSDEDEPVGPGLLAIVSDLDGVKS